MAKTLIQEKKIEDMVRRQVILTLREILIDPDAGLVLTPKAVARLRKSLRSKQEGKTRSLEEVLKKY